MNDDIINSPIKQYNKWLWGIGLLLAYTLIAFIVGFFGLYAGVLILLFPFIIIYTITIFNKPIVGVYVSFFYCFFLYALGRYVIKDALPPGVLYDGLIAYSYAILLFKGLSGKVEWARLKDAPILVLIVWLVYCMLSLVNPESPGFNAWMIAFRPHMYMILGIPLFCLLIDVKSLKTMLILWGVFSMILTVKGITQQLGYLDNADNLFLSVNYTTHLIWGKLRVFSYCSDAGQFGAQQAQAGVVGAVLFLSEKSKLKRFFFLLMALTGILGMFISGTRGAMFVLVGGALAYCFIIRKIKLLLLSLILMGGFYCVMRYTYIGSGIYAIHRMRSAFVPSADPSYLVRKNNQKILREYLSTRPMGGGLGSMEHGVKGSVLYEIPHDSGYVLTWGDQGIIGVSMYILMFLYFLIKGTWNVWFRIKNEWLRGVLIALIAGISGDAVAHYGNPIMLQFPTCIVVFFNIAVLFIAPRLDKELMQEDNKEPVKTTQLVKRSAYNTMR